MRTPRCVGAAALVLLVGCEPSATRPAPEAGLALEIVFAHDGPVTVDAGTVRIQGPQDRTISLTPGSEQIIDLAPGSYLVSLEALASGEVVGFAQRSATVREGQVTTVSLSPSSFIPSITGVPATAEVDVPFTVAWSAVPGAASYRLEAALDPDFSTVQDSENATSTSISLTTSSAAVWYFRVRALTEFGSMGHPSAHSTGTQVLQATGSAPSITEFGLEYLPVQGCPAGAVDFSTVEYFQYEDEDGDVPGGNLGPGEVDAGYRFSDQNDWTSYSPDWDRSGGDGHGGELVNATCWDAHDEQTHVDVRVRLRDADGNWSQWAEARLSFPDAIQILPDGGTSGVAVGSGQSVEFSATATFEGDPVPGDPIVWSNTNSPGLASVDAAGIYTLTSGGQGVDRIFARAVFAYADEGIVGPDAGAEGTWWAPCWEIAPFSLANGGDWYRYRMRVQEGRQYRMDVIPSSSSASGDPDLYLGFNSAPTLADHVASGTTPGDDSILWTAHADGVVWIGIYAFSPFSDYLFQVVTPDGLCGAPGTTPYPPSPVAPSGAVQRAGELPPRQIEARHGRLPGSGGATRAGAVPRGGPGHAGPAGSVLSQIRAKAGR